MGSRRTSRPCPNQQRQRGRHFGGLPRGTPCEGARTCTGQSGSRRSPQNALGRLRKGLEEVASGGVAADLRDVRDVWEEAVAAPDWEDRPVWLHGDLHPANVVVSDGALSGVIDFGDMCAGDPAVDLAAAWVLLPAGAAARFFDAYAYVDEAMIRRARGWLPRRAFSSSSWAGPGSGVCRAASRHGDPRAGRRSTVFWHQSRRLADFHVAQLSEAPLEVRRQGHPGHLRPQANRTRSPGTETRSLETGHHPSSSGPPATSYEVVTTGANFLARRLLFFGETAPIRQLRNLVGAKGTKKSKET